MGEEAFAPAEITFGWWEEDPLVLIECSGQTSQQVLATAFVVPAAHASHAANSPLLHAGQGSPPSRYYDRTGGGSRRPGHALIVLASWAESEQLCQLRMDWARLGPPLGIAHPAGPAPAVGAAGAAGQGDTAGGAGPDDTAGGAEYGDTAGGPRLWSPTIAGVQPGFAPIPLQWETRGAAAADGSPAAGQGAVKDRGPDSSIPYGSVPGGSILGPGAFRPPATALRSATLRLAPAAGLMLILDFPSAPYGVATPHGVARESGGRSVADASAPPPARAAAATAGAEDGGEGEGGEGSAGDTGGAGSSGSVGGAGKTGSGEGGGEGERGARGAGGAMGSEGVGKTGSEWPPAGTSARIRRWQEEEAAEVEAARVEKEASEAAAAAVSSTWFTPAGEGDAGAPGEGDAGGEEGEEEAGGEEAEALGQQEGEEKATGVGAWLLP